MRSQGGSEVSIATLARILGTYRPRSRSRFSLFEAHFWSFCSFLFFPPTIASLPVLVASASLLCPYPFASLLFLSASCPGLDTGWALYSPLDSCA